MRLVDHVLDHMLHYMINHMLDYMIIDLVTTALHMIENYIPKNP